MERVLLVVANREQFPEPAFPLGALYVAGALEAAGSEARIFDAGLHRRPLAALRAELAAFRPVAVGLSLRNADNAAFPCTRTYLGWHERVARTIHAAAPGARLVAGGPAFSIFAAELLVRLGADAGVAGDGEGAATLLASGSGAEMSVAGRAAGVSDARSGDEAPARVWSRPPSDLREVRLPDRLGSVFPGARRYRTASVQTARGCPHGCIYCTYPALEGARLRPRPPEAVADEAERLHRELGARELFVVDSSFNADEAHLAAVCEALRRRRLPVRFSCYLQPRMRDPELFVLLAAAGCTAVDFGSDSAAADMLPALGKSFTVGDLREATRAARAAGLDTCHSLLFGGPGETPETAAETVRVMDELTPTAVVAMAGLRIYPGTALAERARAAGLLGERDSLLSPRFYAAGMAAEDPRAAWLFAQVRAAAAERRSWFLPGARDWSAAWGPRLLRRLGKPGPLWRNFPRPRWYRYL
ncbi:MAG: radical SAM protein [Thermoleophilia bacterium]